MWIYSTKHQFAVVGMRRVELFDVMDGRFVVLFEDKKSKVGFWPTLLNDSASESLLKRIDQI